LAGTSLNAPLSFRSDLNHLDRHADSSQVGRAARVVVVSGDHLNDTGVVNQLGACQAGAHRADQRAAIGADSLGCGVGDGVELGVVTADLGLLTARDTRFDRSQNSPPHSSPIAPRGPPLKPLATMLFRGSMISAPTIPSGAGAHAAQGARVTEPVFLPLFFQDLSLLMCFISVTIAGALGGSSAALRSNRLGAAVSFNRGRRRGQPRAHSYRARAAARRRLHIGEFPLGHALRAAGVGSARPPASSPTNNTPT
jgi:hypothetical protein